MLHPSSGTHKMMYVSLMMGGTLIRNIGHFKQDTQFPQKKNKLINVVMREVL